ncbi:MAG: histidinol phosphate phosphatase domain-containing protein [Halobacteriales archaeon]|nr:histidinol phosphate phosphatase domain-containing protein [Halobacteriales archaeon]
MSDGKPGMIDLHSHTFVSDGELVPAEHARRAEVQGVEVLGITDHADASNVQDCVERVERAKETTPIRVLSGVEVTHVPPGKIERVVEMARDAGADIVVAHGETPVEPVVEGTNRSAIEAGVDVLGHPGLITPEDAELAAERGVRLEITARGGHSLANGHVAKVAEEKGAELVVNTDSHHPRDFITRDRAVEIARLAGLSEERAVEVVDENPREFLDEIL